MKERREKFHQLLRLRAGKNQNIKHWLSGKYTSHDIISNIIEIMAQCILTLIIGIERIRKNEFFFIILMECVIFLGMSKSLFVFERLIKISV